ncbi:hypothetical protein PHABIO_396 [Pseudomonas phage Phabio]|uniref:Uncharacterized protein n=1 Tax=Pseudomonas phage Phabio TaxID=2006668 RepID=A0A1Y0T2E3_9CAUD|nr:hypothetical protein MZD05_gp396 [Pseudomonas phage Phabio]ARV77027.1 hypothetical protein PHABIO_396 [Pseudomonas phage Phabio]
MSFFEDLVELGLGIAKSKVVRGMVLQAGRDIVITRTDRKSGYTEFHYAKEGDDLEVLGEDHDNPLGGFRVINRDNYDQIDTVLCDDLEDTFNDYGK